MDILRSFAVFQKVAEHGSFSRAAENLGLVPSGISRQINELEAWAGLRLINRTTRSLQLTPEGQIYLERLRQITTEVQDIKALGETARNLTGQINLTAPMMLGQFIIPDALARFRHVNPNVDISMTLMNRTVDLIEKGFDVAVWAVHLPASTLMSISAGSAKISTVASPAYIKQYGLPNEPKDLAKYNCLISEPSTQFAR